MVIKAPKETRFLDSHSLSPDVIQIHFSWPIPSATGKVMVATTTSAKTETRVLGVRSRGQCGRGRSFMENAINTIEIRVKKLTSQLNSSKSHSRI
ncbi:MAG: hypothetical protein Q9160_001920 [Pyrenula sp. 1 TL-2023]